MVKNIPGISWQGPTIDDVEILAELPSAYRDILGDINGFILFDGVLHVRGASVAPDWHSIRAAWKGEKAFHRLYDSVRTTDIPFAQDQFGDQLLIRDSKIMRLLSETGEIEPLVENLEIFFDRVQKDIKGFLNVGLNHSIEPGQLLFAYPPFCFKESGAGASLRPVEASEVILFHADLAKQLRDLPVGKQIALRVVDR